jgi:hypothetical protein
MNIIAMSEEFWMNSQLSIARYYGEIVFNGHRFVLVNKKGISLMELSDPQSKHFVKSGKAIEAGEPADLIREDFVPQYKRLGRDLFQKILSENSGVPPTALLKIFKQTKKDGTLRESKA